MDYKEEYEQKIDLKDLMFHVVYRWRSLLLVAVLACAMAVGYVGWYNSIFLPDNQARIQEQLERQKELLNGLEEGQQADPIQKQIVELEKELVELIKFRPVKCGVIGFVLGFIGLAFWYALCYMFSDRMHEERELLDRYGYYLLGTFPRRRKGKALRGLDRFLEKESGKVSEKEVYEIISANIKNLAKDGDLLLVTGTVDVEKLKKITKTIIPLVQKEVKLVVGADMNHTADTLEALGKCDAVILVEERGEALRRMIQREYESIAALEKPVVGYVVL